MAEREAERAVLTIPHDGERWGAGLTVAPTVAQGPSDPLAVYLASLRPAGRAALVRALRVVARLLKAEYETFPWHELRYQHVAAIRELLQEQGWAPASVNLVLSALRGIARAAWNLGHLTAEEYARVRDVRPARGVRLPAGRAARPGELRGLVAACADDPTPAGVRDAALLAVLYAGGLRRAEVAGLDVADWDGEAGALRVRRGKGDKERLVYLDAGAARALADWLALRGEGAGPLFHPINKGGTLLRRRLSAQAIYDMLKKRVAGARLAASLSPHDLRRTLIGDLLDAGVDLSTVQQLAGHASVVTTARYDRRGVRP